MERRSIEAKDEELRAVTENGTTRLIGYAAVYDRLSLEMVESKTRMRFRERILPGAFDEVLRTNPDVVAVFNHDNNVVLGRSSSGTLSLASDGIGLRYEVLLNPETQIGRDVAAMVARRDVRGSSFAFTVGNEDVIKDGNQRIREVRSIAKLIDVGPVVFPAYPDATVAVRSIEESQDRPKGSNDWLKLRLKTYR